MTSIRTAFRATFSAAALILWCACQAQLRVCIDPGHPSEVGKGTKGKRISEIQLAWDIALLVDAKLKAKNVQTKLTKGSRDEYVANKKRAQIANAFRADLMIRFHCDHAVGESGFATFYANRAGKDGGKSGPSKAVLAQVKPMAQAFHDSLKGSLKGELKDRGLRTDTQTAVGAKKGALIGSIHSNVPSILIEMVVLSSKSDEDWILASGGKAKMADAIVSATMAALKRKSAK